MILQDLLLEENSTVKQAIERLESVRCKVVYIVKGKKLLASVSDGDVRRFSLRSGDIYESVFNIANLSPTSFYEHEKDKWIEIFRRTELYSVPIINYNDEIIGVVFRDGTVIKEREKISVPVVMVAGGKGARLYPYTKILPKALIPIGDIPISEHILNRFYESGCTSFFMIINHKRAMIQSYFDSIEKNYSLRYIEETTPLGTGGGLSLLKDIINEDFIFTNCDIIIDADYAAIYKMHKKKNNFITMILSKYTADIPYGVVEMDKENNYSGTTEKPSFTYNINTGVYIVNPRVIEELPENTAIGFPDIIERYHKSGEKIGCYIVSESAYMDMGQLEELEKMKKKLNV